MSTVAAVSPVVLRELTARMIGAQAWRSRAGSGTGSIFTLEFGPPLPGNAIQGEFSLMVYCAWRVVALGSGLLFSWHDDPDEVLAPGLATLEGLVVTSVDVSEWHDLKLGFADGRQLQVMNDLSPLRDWDTSWFITYQGETHYCVNTDNSITREIDPH
ncbi:hypothetical protein [Hymenobacter lucidus]|uniref:Uncharacterized protein n=1 Tax=Hymenobacter lucidus TaxID=2880930 RepID=A0ABS8AVZ2_9BACT|nr:hypothetical protein [Hymenobacter lucidus]MCB2410058.1 hypothetical protein [Hymenobacter lucidus]